MPKQPNDLPLKDKYINPLTDFGFKKLFATEANKDLLIDFLNTILPERHQIEDLTYDKNEQQGRDAEDRIAVFDIFCKSKNGEHFIIEIQRKKQINFKDRSIFYSTHPIHDNALKGKDWDFKLPIIYTIAILDFTFDDYSDKTKFIHHVNLRDEEGKVFYDKLNYIYIELPKFTKTLEELETHFEKWLFALKWLSNLFDRPKALQERVFLKLFKIAEVAKFSKKERMEYEQDLKRYRDYYNTIDYAKQEGVKEGEIKGKIEEREENNLNAIKMGLKEGFPLEIILKFTNGLTMNEVKKIIKNLEEK